MSFEARAGQDAVLTATEPVVLVLGAAGTGKTTTAAATVRRILDQRRAAAEYGARALFLSFSRAAVAQVIDRTQSLLGPHADNVEITTFHAFAWHLIKRWGTAIGVDDPTLVSPSEARLLGTTSGLTYDQLLPMALRLVRIPAIARHLRRRWAVIVSDEFQDTSDQQFELITLIRGDARLLLLGDPNQCIYTTLPGADGVGPQRLAAALALPGSRQIDLPDVSHRDPSNILPAAAAAIRRRDFGHVAVDAALGHGRLAVHHHDDLADEGPVVAQLVGELKAEGHSVAVFSHHVDATAALSDHLNQHGVSHEIVGLPDTVDSALRAQFEMLCYAAGHGSSAAVRHALAVFVTSTERGTSVPALALIIAQRQTGPAAFDARMQQLGADLSACATTSQALAAAATTPEMLGLTRGERPWASAATILRNILGPRLLRATGFPSDGLEALRPRLADQHVSLLTYTDTSVTADVQLMGLYQSKGREADATIVVLRAGDYYGREGEPMPHGSKLLYVVLTRARHKTVVVTLGSRLPALVAPLLALSRP